ncbi:hypothetical protein J6590_054037 [Homalodisca vitripennis]|nr:hypothetical protein J6590_054037 [Homalodisca vitripennis]
MIWMFPNQERQVPAEVLHALFVIRKRFGRLESVRTGLEASTYKENKLVSSWEVDSVINVRKATRWFKCACRVTLQSADRAGHVTRASFFQKIWSEGFVKVHLPQLPDTYLQELLRGINPLVLTLFRSESQNPKEKKHAVNEFQPKQ